MNNESIHEEENDYKFSAIILFFIFLLINVFFIRRSIIFIIMILSLSIPYVSKKIFKIKIKKIPVSFFLFWIYYILETFMYSFLQVNFYTERGVYDFIFRVFLVLLIFFTFSTNSEKVNDYFFILVRKLGFFLCILGWIEYLNKRSLLYNIITVSAKDWQLNVFGTSRFRIYTIFLHPIVYGIFLIVLFWIVINYNYKNYYFNAFFLFLIISNLYFTKSRSAWITLVLTLLINYLIRHKKYIKKRKKTFSDYMKITILLIVIVILGYIFRKKLLEVISSIFLRFKIVIDSSSVDGSRTQRLGAFTNLKKFFNEDIIGFIIGRGVGYSSVFTASHPINQGFDIVDNQYISIIYDTGIIGIIFFLRVFILIIKNIKKYYVSKSKKVCLMGIISIYINIFFYEGLSFYSTLIMLSIFIFMISTDYKSKEISKFE